MSDLGQAAQIESSKWFLKMGPVKKEILFIFGAINLKKESGIVSSEDVSICTMFASFIFLLFQYLFIYNFFLTYWKRKTPPYPSWLTKIEFSSLVQFSYFVLFCSEHGVKCSSFRGILRETLMNWRKRSLVSVVFECGTFVFLFFIDM